MYGLNMNYGSGPLPFCHDTLIGTRSTRFFSQLTVRKPSMHASHGQRFSAPPFKDNMLSSQEDTRDSAQVTLFMPESRAVFYSRWIPWHTVTFLLALSSGPLCSRSPTKWGMSDVVQCTRQSSHLHLGHGETMNLPKQIYLCLLCRFYEILRGSPYCYGAPQGLL